MMLAAVKRRHILDAEDLVVAHGLGIAEKLLAILEEGAFVDIARGASVANVLAEILAHTEGVALVVGGGPDLTQGGNRRSGSNEENKEFHERSHDDGRVLRGYVDD
ncbi:uncharacterized protein PgNI_02232 [Pyricularia grisea]|uniref:Uncharacterized protein n=1 Tax=Pyricularia grisea TaxID=148305 RepID=A0A6P8BKA9_PYRGI|nr:uncharacterized protein PgNI_02232 [Pyricularia grisea]TLD17331.1 hypothetical protein PgNI_02232 [Pyricularia grisea]